MAKYSMQNEDIQLAQILWDWLPLQDSPKKSDILFVLGNASTRLPVFAAELYLQGYAPNVLICGGKGRMTQDNEDTEAQRYRTVLVDGGVPSDKIILEDQSNNTFENIESSKQMIKNKNIPVASGIAATTALMSRRHKAMLYKLWPEVEWRIATPEPQTLDQRLAEDGNSIFIDLLVGEIDRLEKYPSRGGMDSVEIPDNIVDAKGKLISLGYDHQLAPSD